VEHGSDDNKPVLLDDLVNHAIRKAFRVSPANVLPWMATAMQHRIYREFIEHIEDFFDKSIPETLAVAAIPRCDFDNVSFYFRP